MPTNHKRLDLVSIGRCAIDMYCNEVGTPLKYAKSFNIYVGGCPANIAIAAQRLGLKTAIVSRVGAEPLGDFIVNFLETEGISVEAITRDAQHLTGLVVLGIEPPDKFPMTMYRNDCADINLNLDDVRAAPLAEASLVVVSGTGFSREPSASATTAAVEDAHAAGAEVVLDLDYRPGLWDDARVFGPTIRRIVASAELVVGTEEEVRAAGSDEDVEAAAARLLATAQNLKALVVKRGQRGCTVMTPAGDVIDVPPFSVKVLNVIGAGDAFAAGFLSGYLRHWDWYKCGRLGNATGAIIVTRHACSSDMPQEKEVLEFVAANGGF